MLCTSALLAPPSECSWSCSSFGYFLSVGLCSISAMSSRTSCMAGMQNARLSGPFSILFCVVRTLCVTCAVLIPCHERLFSDQHE